MASSSCTARRLSDHILTHLERGRSPDAPPPADVEGLLDGQLSQDVSVEEEGKAGASREARDWGATTGAPFEREGLNWRLSAERCSFVQGR